MSDLRLFLQLIVGTTTSKDVVIKFRKSLNDMFKDQCSRFPVEMGGVLPPKHAKIGGIMAALGRKKSALARERYEDPGLNHLTRTRLSKDQLERISMYGLIDGAPKPLKFSTFVSPQVHFTVIAGLSMFMRSDTVLSLRLPSVFVLPCPGPSCRQTCTLLAFCTDDVSRAPIYVVSFYLML